MAKNTLSTDQNTLKNFLSKHQESHYNHCNPHIYKISSGSKRLDYYMDGGFSSGIHRLAGASEGGKTSEALNIVYNAFQTLPKCKCVFVKAEGRLSDPVKLRSGLKFVEMESDVDQWDNHSVFVLKTNVFEPTLDLMKALINDNPDGYIYIFIIDSLDGMNLADDIGKKFTDNAKVAGVPMLTKRFFQQMSLPISESGHMVFIITQVTAEIKMQYDKAEQKHVVGSGGNSALHFPDWILVFEPTLQGDYITQGKVTMSKVDLVNNPILGHWAKILIRKSTNETTGYTVKYPIKHARKDRSCIWEEYEVFKFLQDWGFIEAKGAWIYFTDRALEIMADGGVNMDTVQHKTHGEAVFIDYLEANRPITDFWLNYQIKITTEATTKKEILG